MQMAAPAAICFLEVALTPNSVSTRFYPAGMLNTLSQHEVDRLHDASQGDLAHLLRQCTLAVLNSGAVSDDPEALMERHKDFEIRVQSVNRGLRLELVNAPGAAFVDGRIIEGIRELLSAVIRDLVYFDSEIKESGSPALLDFYATWCGPCKTIAPIVEELAKEYAKQGLKVGKVDIDSDGDLATQRAGPCMAEGFFFGDKCRAHGA